MKIKLLLALSFPFALLAQTPPPATVKPTAPPATAAPQQPAAAPKPALPPATAAAPSAASQQPVAAPAASPTTVSAPAQQLPPAQQPVSPPAATMNSVDTTKKNMAEEIPQPSPQIEAQMTEYKATSRFFMGIVDPFGIDLKSVASCKKLFTDLCGASSYPRAGSFTLCLQKKFDSIKANPSCDGLARGLIGSNFLVWVARTTQNCDIHYQKCFMNLKPQTSEAFNKCMATDPTVSPLCTKLVQEAVLNGYVMNQIYDKLQTSW